MLTTHLGLPGGTQCGQVSRGAAETNAVSGADLERLPDTKGGEILAQRREKLQRLLDLIQQLKFIDRQVMLAYLEGMEAAAIGELTGLSTGNVATKIHRIKRFLARRFEDGGNND